MMKTVLLLCVCSHDRHARWCKVFINGSEANRVIAADSKYGYAVVFDPHIPWWSFRKRIRLVYGTVRIECEVWDGDGARFPMLVHVKGTLIDPHDPYVEPNTIGS